MTSFLDTLFGTFTGEPAIQAANAARETLGNVYSGLIGQNRWAEEQALGGISDTAAIGRGLAFPYFGGARGDIAQGAWNSGAFYDQNYLDPFQGNQTMVENALGLNGPGGTQAAHEAFTTSPGYGFMMEQGLDAIARNANAAGMLASGNMLQESQRFGSGLAAQEYNNWLRNLTQRESMYAPIAAREADLWSEMGRNLGNLDLQTAQYLGSSFTDEGQRRANALLGFMGPETSAAGIFGPALASTNLAVGAAQQQAGANTLGALGNLATTLAGIF